MRNSSSVRRPSLASSSVTANHSNMKSIGDTLRKARKDLFFTRCLGALIIVLLVTVIVALFTLGYVDRFIDYIFAFVE